ncbi:MAG: hypothetical protein KDI92_09710 [Xanthomonadales bacterium]|nr:hypothetical protein [Xanthomonadales bacterium]
MKLKQKNRLRKFFSLLTIILYSGFAFALNHSEVELIIPPKEGVAGLVNFFGDEVLIDNGRMIVTARDVARHGALMYFELENDNWVEKQQILPIGNSADVNFGKSVAWDDTVLVVGAPSRNNDSENDSVYIYRLNDGEWSLEQKISSVDRETDEFGYSVAIENDLLFFGAGNCRFDFSTTDCVFGFVKTDDLWQQYVIIKPDQNFYNNNFGSNLYIDNNELFIGDDSARDGTNHNIGGVAHYQLINGEWTYIQSIFAEDSSSYDEFSNQIILDGNSLFVSAPGHDLPNQNNGAIYIFERENPKAPWIESSKIQPKAHPDSKFFGGSLSLHGNKLLVGSKPIYPDFNYDDEAFLYIKKADQWIETHITNPFSGRLGLFGHSVAIYEDKFIVTEPSAGDNFDGSIHFYRLSNNLVNYSSEIKALVGTPSAEFGKKIASDGQKLFISSSGEFRTDGGFGSVYIYDKSPNNHDLLLQLDNPDQMTFESFGLDLAVDSGYLSISSPFDDDLGILSGAVYVYDESNQWSKAQKLLPELSNQEGRYGLSIDFDNSRLVVSEPFKNVEGVGAVGEVHFYQMIDSQWVLEHTLRPQENVGDDRFGKKVKLSNEHLMVASINNFDINFGTGEVDIYLQNGAEWVYLQRFTDLNENYRNIGYQIEINGTLAAISAVSNSLNAGVVFLMEFDGVSWNFQQALYADDFHSGDQFGSSIFFLDDSIYIGAPGNDSLGSNAGTIYQYSKISDEWKQIHKITSLTQRNGIEFGSSMTSINKEFCMSASKDTYRGEHSGSVICRGKDRIFKSSFD